jgi:hypothetical protein
MVNLTNAAGLQLVWPNLLYIDTFSPIMLSTPGATPNESGSVPPGCNQVREAQPVGVPKTTTVALPSSLNGQTVYLEADVGNVLDHSFDGYAWIDDIRLLGGSPGTLGLSLAQPLGPGSIRIVDTGVVAGVETFNAISLEPAPGGVGTGPYLGLWTANVNLLIGQVLAPVGTQPFHVLPISPTYTFGPLTNIPAGLTIEMVAFEWNGSVFGRTSTVAALTTQ